MTTFLSQWKDLKVILSHDWLTGMRGGERILELLCRGFPEAPVYTLIHKPSAVSDTINHHHVTTSWLQHIPGIMKNYRLFLPLFPSAIEAVNTVEADLLISTSHCVAKGLKPCRNTRHLCYCFTPMRYAWLFYDEYFGKNPLKKMALSPILRKLRAWDREASKRVDLFVTISRHVQKRIRDFYGREADVVYPFVNRSYWTPDPARCPGMIRGRDMGTYDLIVSALVPYKRIDLAVQAYARLGYPLIIVGAGPELHRLRKLADQAHATREKNIQFIGWASDEHIRELYRHCRALVFTGEEDFGIVPLEAQACGRPVVAYGRGGALETVTEGITGVFFYEQTQQALTEAVERCASLSWDPAAIRINTEQFSEEQFIKGMTKSINKCMNRR